MYKYTCMGCNQKRFSYVFDVAQEKICNKCKSNQVPDNQPSLFDTILNPSIPQQNETKVDNIA